MTTFPEPEPLETGELTQLDEDAVLEDVATQVDALEQVVDLTPLDHPHRLLLVHAHPDDETVGTGATIAHYCAGHALVTLVTCTRGELGEVVDPELAGLASTGPDDDRLGERRVQEMAAAAEALGLSDHRYLGGPGRWRDSGMAGEPSNDDPRCFWQADLAQATSELVAVVREIRPQVVITYDANGGYGHPDHIQAHRVTLAAVEAAGDPDYQPEAGEPWQVGKMYEMALREESVRSLGLLDQLGDGPRPTLVSDEAITTVLDGSDQRQAKLAAMRAHRSQIDLSSGLWHLLAGHDDFYREYYRLTGGERGPGDGPNGWETDLFGGLER